MLPLSWMRVCVVMGLSILASMLFEPLLGIVLPVPPAITLVVVCVVAAENGPLYGVASGMIAGLLLDLFGASALGVNMGSLALVGFCVGRTARFLPLWPPVVRVAIVTPLTFLYIPAARFLAFVAGEPIPLSFRTAVHFAVANVLIAVLVTPVIAAASLRARRA